MWASVTPSARQCGPPELLATLPPIEHVCWLLGSGAKCRPWPATARRAGRGSARRARPTPVAATGRRDSDAVHLRRRDDDRARPAARRRRPGRCPTRGRRTARRGGAAIAHARLDLGGRHAGSTRRPPRPPCATRRGGTATARSRRRAPDRAPSAARGARRRARWRTASAARSLGALGRRSRITRPDSTGSPSTSTSSPGCEVVAEAHEPAVALGAQLALADLRRRAAPRARRRRRGARPPHRATAPRGDVGRRQPAAPSPLTLRLAYPAPAAPAATPPANHTDAPHHAPRRSRRTARDVPVARPGGLDHRRRQRRAGDPARRGRGVADRLGRTEHPVEAVEVGAGRGHRRAGLVGRRAQLVQQRRRSRRAGRRPRRAAHPSVSRTRTQRRRRARRTPSAQSTAPTTSTSSPAVTPPPPSLVLVLARRASCARRPPARARGGSARYQRAVRAARRGGTAGRPSRRVRRGRAHEGTRSPRRGRAPWRPGSWLSRRWAGTSPSGPGGDVAAGRPDRRSRCGCSSAPSPGGSPPGPG